VWITPASSPRPFGFKNPPPPFSSPSERGRIEEGVMLKFDTEICYKVK
jgi:hypothetical protein